DVGAATDFLVEPFLGVVGPDLAPDLFGKGGERQEIGACSVEVFGDLGELVGQCIDDPIVLCCNGISVGLVVDRMQQGAYPRPRRLRGDGHQVRGVVGAAALPGRTGQGRSNGCQQPGVGVAWGPTNPRQGRGGGR